jgi:hypothetical protein
MLGHIIQQQLSETDKEAQLGGQYLINFHLNFVLPIVRLLKVVSME